MKWRNFFKSFTHCYDPVIVDGKTVYINMRIMYPVESLAYEIKVYGLITAWDNFKKVMQL
jgi:hypothetical protein